MAAGGDSQWAHLLRPRTPEDLTAVFILLSFATLAAFMPAQNDTWWHLAAGRRIAETRTNRARRPFLVDRRRELLAEIPNGWHNWCSTPCIAPAAWCC